MRCRFLDALRKRKLVALRAREQALTDRFNRIARKWTASADDEKDDGEMAYLVQRIRLACKLARNTNRILKLEAKHDR